MLELQENYERQLAEIGSYDEQMAELNKQIAVSHEELMQQAAVLSTQRQIAAQRIEKELVEMVQPLGMPNAVSDSFCPAGGTCHGWIG